MAKLTDMQKIEIHKKRLMGVSSRKLALEFNVSYQYIDYLIRVLNKHGYSILKNSKYTSYSKDFKIKAIKRVLINQESIICVAIDIGLTSKTILQRWLKKYKENCYNVIENKRGRKPKTITKIKRSKKILTKEDKIKDLEKEILYLKAENEYLKKLNALVQEEELAKNKELE